MSMTKLLPTACNNYATKCNIAKSSAQQVKTYIEQHQYQYSCLEDYNRQMALCQQMQAHVLLRMKFKHIDDVILNINIQEKMCTHSSDSIGQ